MVTQLANRVSARSSYAAALTDALAGTVVYQQQDWDDYRQLGFPGAVEVDNMFQYYAEDTDRFTRARDLTLVRDVM
jgi:hypothetical protein